MIYHIFASHVRHDANSILRSACAGLFIQDNCNEDGNIGYSIRLQTIAYAKLISRRAYQVKTSQSVEAVLSVVQLTGLQLPRTYSIAVPASYAQQSHKISHYTEQYSRLVASIKYRATCLCAPPH